MRKLLKFQKKLVKRVGGEKFDDTFRNWVNKKGIKNAQKITISKTKRFKRVGWAFPGIFDEILRI